MNKQLLLWAILGLGLAVPVKAASAFNQPVLNVIDISSDPNIFEASLSIDEQDAVINGTVVHTIIYKDDNQPGAYAGTPSLSTLVPQIEVKVGDEVIVHFSNNLAPNCAAIDCDSSIHWHGIGIDNDSDGTGVTQNHLLPGQTYTYRYIVPRPGIFWFHPHMNPSPQVFAGAYGIFIAKPANEENLQINQTIPSAANTYSLVLADIEYDTMGDVGYIDSMTMLAVPWRILQDDCAMGMTSDCNKFQDADTVLVNGGLPIASSTPLIKAKSGSGIRLRLANTSTIRYFRLQVTGNGSDNNLYRIGGEGGFLDFARLEGGTMGTWVTGYNQGEIVLAPGQRADVVLVPTGNTGDKISIAYPPFSRGQFPASSGPDLLFIEIDNSIVDVPFSIADGTPILGQGGVEDLKLQSIVDFFETPYPIMDHPETPIGLTSQTIEFKSIGAGMTSIDGFMGMLDDSGPDYEMVMYGGSTRYANVRDTLEFTVKNTTQQHHPFHLHGFSFQPVRVIDNFSGATLYTYDYNEFVDTIDIYASKTTPTSNGQSIIMRMRLDDRARITDNRQEPDAPPPNEKFTQGGAIGRWVFHCHIFLHAATGMMSELVVRDDQCNVDSDCLSGGTCTVGTCDELHQCNYASIPNCCKADVDCDDHNVCTTDTCIEERCDHQVAPTCRIFSGGGGGGFIYPPLIVPARITPVAGPPEISSAESVEQAPVAKWPTDEKEGSAKPETSGCSSTGTAEHSIFILALLLWLFKRRRLSSIDH